MNQVLRSLSQHGLVRTDEPLHMLTDEGLTYLARRIVPPWGLPSTAGAPSLCT